MEIKRAKKAGFCFGVKRAVDMVYREIEMNKEQKIYTYGPIIHNEEVIKDMKKKGVGLIQTEEELEEIAEGVIILRSHGVGRHIYKKLGEKGIKCVDATCPFVKKIHEIVETQSKEGRKIIIIGNAQHPEVIGIRGWTEEEAIVIGNEEEAKRFVLGHEYEKLCMVAQTTFNYNKFEELVEIICKKGYDVNVLNTICNATKERQTEAKSIAEESEVMIVIGDKHSSNTQKLFEICKNACRSTYYIQTLADLDLCKFRNVRSVGITAGASTPNNIIEEVQNNVRVNF